MEPVKDQKFSKTKSSQAKKFYATVASVFFVTTDHKMNHC